MTDLRIPENMQRRVVPWRRIALALATMAMVVAGYLSVISWSQRGLPIGCGAGSGCSDVLRSRWSNIGGLPVGILAVGAYGVLVWLLWRATLATAPRQRAFLLITVATSILTVAMYFVLLQVVVIEAICAWCMLDHSLGMTAALVSMIVARRMTQASDDAPERSDPDDPFAESAAATPTRKDRPSALVPVLTGTLLAAGFVLASQLAGRPPEVGRMAEQIEATTAAEGGLELAVKNGTVVLPLAMLPSLGTGESEKRLILLFDYCCPHCREAHAAIRKVQPLASDWQVILVPTPLNTDCNQHIEETEERFRDACELARLSLAIWAIRPDDWPAFDAWLFEPELPRTSAEARAHAAALYGEIEVAEALSKPGPGEVIAADVALFRAMGTKVLPVILSPGVSGVTGRTETSEELLQILKADFGYPTR